MACLNQNFVLASLFLFVFGISATIELKAPRPSGRKDRNQGNAPCGGTTLNFHADEPRLLWNFWDGIGTESAHPLTNWLYRGTLDQTTQSGWTQLYPIVKQDGFGLYCQRGLSVPADWNGKVGVIGVVANTNNELLYECAPVRFDAKANIIFSDCGNSSNVIATLVQDDTLAAVAGGTTPSQGGPSQTSNPTTLAPPSATATRSSSCSRMEPWGLATFIVGFGFVILAQR